MFLARYLKRPLLIQMLKQIAFVRLIPRNSARRNRTKIEAVDIGTSKNFFAKYFIIGDHGAHQSRTDTAEQFLLWHLHHADKGK